MSHPDPIVETRNIEHSGNSRHSSMGWNILAVLFLFAGIVVAVLAFQEISSPVPQLAVELADLQQSPNDPASFLEVHPWKPLDEYSSLFAGRDVFKTDEEKVLELKWQAQMTVDGTAGNWADSYQLIGVIVDEDPRAIIKTLNPPGVKTLAIGDQLGEATLENVEENVAFFQYQNTLTELRFSDHPAK